MVKGRAVPNIGRVTERSALRGGTNFMKQSFSILWLIVGALWSGVVPTVAQLNVTQHHNHDSRDGHYIDPTFTQTNAASLTRDLGFDGTISGNVYAQPLYIDNGPGGVATVIAATESNKVYALDATDGSNHLATTKSGRAGGVNRSAMRQHQSHGHHRYACY